MAKQKASRFSSSCSCAEPRASTLLALALACGAPLALAAACGGRSELDDYSDGIPSVVPLTDQEGQRPGADGGQNGGDGDAAVPGSQQDSGQAAQDSGSLAPKAAVGEACSQAQDCAGDNASCLTKVNVITPVTYPNGYCTVGCQSNDDCPDGTACFMGGPQPGCLVTCSQSSDCRADEGYTCGKPPLSGSTDPNNYCLPPFSLGGFGGFGGNGQAQGNGNGNGN
jgi:hypothetical protein